MAGGGERNGNTIYDIEKAGHRNAQGNRKAAQLSSAQQHQRFTIFPFDMLSEADLIMLQLIGNCGRKEDSIEEKKKEEGCGAIKI